MQKFFYFCQFFKFQNFWSFLVKLCFLRGGHKFQKFSIFSKIFKIWRKYIISDNKNFLKKKIFSKAKNTPPLHLIKKFGQFFQKKFDFLNFFAELKFWILSVKSKFLKWANPPNFYIFWFKVNLEDSIIII